MIRALNRLRQTIVSAAFKMKKSLPNDLTAPNKLL